MQNKKPFYKNIWLFLVVVFITFFTTFVSGNTSIQDSQQTVIAKSTKVVKRAISQGYTLCKWED